MRLPETESLAVREELDRLLASSGFLRNERLSRFLRFVVECRLQGRDDELKESVIGVEVFGRSPDYSPKQDAIVRTEARRLRVLLIEYYRSEGKGQSLVIDVPKGGYTPHFRQFRDELPPRRIPRVPLRRAALIAALIGMTITVAGCVWWRIHDRRAPVPIAVLPFENLSPNESGQFFADGLTGEIINELSLIDGLAVRSQTSSFFFKGKSRSLHEVAEQLRVDYILEGSVLRSGLQSRITVQLIRVRDDLPVWSGRYEPEMSQVVTVQDEISRSVVNSLRLNLGHNRRRYETSAEAYDLYLRGRSLQIQTGPLAFNQTIELFQEAIAKDASFAPAYAGLAAEYALRSGQFRFDMPQEMARMHVVAEKALALDPLSAEALDAMGIAQAREGHWGEAEKSFRRAIEVDSNRSASYSHFARYVLWPVNRIDEGLRELRKGVSRDPLSPEVNYDLSSLLSAAGRQEEAARYCGQLPADFWAKHACAEELLFAHRDNSELIHSLEAEVQTDPAPGSWVRHALACAYASVGRREDAEKLAVASSFNPLNQAQMFACLGDKDRTLDALDRAAPAGPIRIGWILNRTRFAFLRNDPRAIALRRKVGLPI